MYYYAVVSTLEIVISPPRACSFTINVYFYAYAIENKVQYLELSRWRAELSSGQNELIVLEREATALRGRIHTGSSFLVRSQSPFEPQTL